MEVFPLQKEKPFLEVIRGNVNQQDALLALIFLDSMQVVLSREIHNMSHKILTVADCSTCLVCD